MHWIWWLGVGLFVGINLGVALMALVQLSPGRKKVKVQWPTSFSGSPLDGPSTFF